MSGLAASKFSMSVSIAVTRASKKYCQYSISTAAAFEAAPAPSAVARAAVTRGRAWGRGRLTIVVFSVCARRAGGGDSRSPDV